MARHDERVLADAPCGHVTEVRDDRMARFAAGSRRLVGRVLAVGGLIAAGWLLTLIVGLFWASPAAADTSGTNGTTERAASGPAASRLGDFPTASGLVSASDNAEAMAGRKVDGLTSQSTPSLPAPSTADHSSGADGFVPQTNGGGSPGAGDVARVVIDPHATVQRAPRACVLPPVVRTAADEPSFSPD